MFSVTECLSILNNVSNGWCVVLANLPVLKISSENKMLVKKPDHHFEALRTWKRKQNKMKSK